jgi:predicted CoA-substrate-specific enzyme activase
MNYYLGLDIGSINVKIALIDETGKIIRLISNKITSNPKTTVNSLIDELSQNCNLNQISAVGVSGSGKGIIPKEFHWAEYSSSLSIASGLLWNHPDARTIIQIGGQSSLVIELENGLQKPWKVAANPLCAAGTGRFLEQQSYRLGIKIEDFSEIAMKCQGNAPRIAARCSVFAKSDLIHLQQKGVSVEAMLYALCESISRMVVALKKGSFLESIYFVGGVAANSAITRAMNELISSRNGHSVQVIVPQNYLFIEALGAAILSRNKISKVQKLPQDSVYFQYYKTPKLEDTPMPSNGLKEEIEETAVGYLGVDVGSTSTKAVILDESGKNILAKNYLMTAGRPVDAVKQVFSNLLKQGAGKINISGVGVTGSGRYLIGSLIGSDMIKNEITAQTRAAVDIDPDADIIEIGGQDSKLVIKRKGVVVDYQMNKACAAGTGSFIDEMAEMLGISVRNGEFADLALKATHTIDLGTRCAAFMGQAVPSAQREGVSKEVITASLANSIAKNYLSKVVGTRKLGNKVILTGAVFYNKAVVSAFNQQLSGHTLLVAEHREVSGAIGAALLAKESIAAKKSRFKGFEKVVKEECNLSTFNCKSCDNNCSITQMKVQNGKPTFYGSRCDKYDSEISAARKETSFDERDKLLFREYKDGQGTGLSVGIPRSLLVYDYAPLLIGYLNNLGVRVIISGKTNKEITENAVELAYTDSCFPIKLLHGHAEALKNSDFIIFPSAIRLGRKEGEENQKYTCPLVQASPFIIRQVLGLEKKILIPVIDFSMGDKDVIENLKTVATRLGFSPEQGRKAALEGLQSQQRFEADKAAVGARLLQKIQDEKQLGVVILSRSYMSQDSGANLGIAEKLAQLDVIPVPLDFLPLETIDPKKYSDRPYWSYESRLLAGADITSRDSKLYGLVLTNFGCGPNSFILRELEDVMGAKPLGQLEIDEHAAEAGLVTRLEAFVDTIKGYHPTAPVFEGHSKDIYRGTSALVSTGKTLLIPRMGPHADLVAAAMQAYGVNAISLPEPDERNILYSNKFTSGTECLPYRVTLGDFLRYYYQNGQNFKNVEGFMSGSFGPCRLGKYAGEQIRVFKDLGCDFPIRTTVSNNAYGDMGLGKGFERIGWKSIVAVDNLLKLIWRVRPYEKVIGDSDKLFDYYLKKIADRIRLKAGYNDLLQQATWELKGLINPTLPRRPIIGINGEIYLRTNAFSNKGLVKACEAAGLEVVVSPMGEWMKYVSHRNLEDALKGKNIKKIINRYLRRLVQEKDESYITKYYEEVLKEKEPSIIEILAKSNKHLSPKCGSEAVLSIGSGIDWLENPDFAGVISVMPHGCMPGGIVAAMSEKFSTIYAKPWINLTYDGFLETNNSTKINEFAELVRFCLLNDGKIDLESHKEVEVLS